MVILGGRNIDQPPFAEVNSCSFPVFAHIFVQGIPSKWRNMGSSFWQKRPNWILMLVSLCQKATLQKDTPKCQDLQCGRGGYFWGSKISVGSFLGKRFFGVAPKKWQTKRRADLPFDGSNESMDNQCPEGLNFRPPGSLFQLGFGSSKRNLQDSFFP